SLAALPAPTTYVTPAATELQIALCRASALVLPQLPSSVPPPAMLLFATLMPLAAAFAVTQSTPHNRLEVVPLPELSSTLTDHSGAPGATPTPPAASSFAAAIPAT